MQMHKGVHGMTREEIVDAEVLLLQWSFLLLYDNIVCI